MQVGSTYFADTRRLAARPIVYDRSYQTNMVNTDLQLDQVKAARAVLIAAPIALILWASVFALLL